MQRALTEAAGGGGLAAGGGGLAAGGGGEGEGGGDGEGDGDGEGTGSGLGEGSGTGTGTGVGEGTGTGAGLGDGSGAGGEGTGTGEGGGTGSRLGLGDGSGTGAGDGEGTTGLGEGATACIGSGSNGRRAGLVHTTTAQNGQASKGPQTQAQQATPCTVTPAPVQLSRPGEVGAPRPAWQQQEVAERGRLSLSSMAGSVLHAHTRNKHGTLGALPQAASCFASWAGLPTWLGRHRGKVPPLGHAAGGGGDGSSGVPERAQQKGPSAGAAAPKQQPV